MARRSVLRPGTDLRQCAAAALAAAENDDPATAAELAGAVLVAAGAGDEPVAAAVAGRALGIVRRDEGHLDDARALLEAAMANAARVGARREAAQAGLSLVGVHVLAGRLDLARRVGHRAAPDLDEHDNATLDLQLALVDERSHRFTEALAAYERAEEVLGRLGDTRWLARLRVNRAVLLAQLGRLTEAERDTQQAASELAGTTGPLTAILALNLAWFSALAADVPIALERYDAAVVAARAASWPVGMVLRDQAELLAAVGLFHEAVDAAMAAVEDLDRASPTDAAEARLVLASALAGCQRHDAAAATASAAAAAFTAQQRPVWAARAQVLAAAVSATPSASGVERVLDAARDLATAGLATEAAEARSVAVRLAVSSGVPVPAAALPLVPAIGPPWVQARAWLAEAMRRGAAGDRRGASRAASAGLVRLETLRRTLGSVELRAGLAAVAAELADLLVACAADGRRPHALLAAAERRTGPAVRATAAADAPMVGALGALRAAAGRATTAGDGEEASTALRMLHRAESEVRRLSRRADGHSEDVVRADVAAIADRLGDVRLVRYVVSRGAVVAVVVDRRGSRRFDLGAVAPVEAASDRLRAGLRRQAANPAPRARGAVVAAARELDDSIVAPLRSRLGDGSVVLVPDGALHGIAWGALPSLASRPVTTSPSATAWLVASDRSPAPDRRAVLVGGPGLASAPSEAERAADAWRAHGGEASVLVGMAATVTEVRASLDGARLAHLACHGRVRPEAPVFSSLELADGPLTGFDLELLTRAPSTIVLAACDVGTSASATGSEVLGFPAWLLGAGARTVIASVVPVPDERGTVVFGTIAAALAVDVAPAEALLAAAAVDVDIAAGLQCTGVG